jgi:hypothetical protein
MVQGRNLVRQDAFDKVSMASNTQQLKDQLAAAKERERLLKERTDRIRKEAELLGMPKAEVQAAGIGELEAVIDDRKRKEKERERLAGRMMLERDQRAVVAAGQDFGKLGEAQVRYFMGNTGVSTTNEAQEVWKRMGLADRAMAFGVRDEKLISKLMSDDQATARLAAADEERKRKIEEETADRKLIGTKVDLPEGNTAVWTSRGQLQVLPKEKEKYEREVYQGDFVRGPNGTVQEWNPTKEVYDPVRPDPVTMEQVWDPAKKDFVKKAVEKDRWAGVNIPPKRQVFESEEAALAAKLPIGTPVLVKSKKTGKYVTGTVR